MGCGRVGGRLALMFDREQHQVSVIDLHAGAFERLGPDFQGITIVGTGIDEDVLKSAGIEQADVFLALTSQDNPNIMAAQIAQLRFKVPRVVTRIYDPPREDTFHDLGLETICPTTLVADRIHQAIISNATAPLSDDAREALPGETLARTHTTVMPTAEVAETPPTPAPSDKANASWRQRIFRQ